MNFDRRVVPPLERRLAFFDSIQLPGVIPSNKPTRLAYASLSTRDEQKENASLIGDTLLSCMSGMTRAEKREIKNSVKFSLLMSHEYENQVLSLARWIDLFSRTLNHLGWYTDRKPGERVYTDLSQGVSRKMLDTVRALGNEPMITNSLQAFAALKANPSGLSAYARSSLYGNAFQVMPAGRDSQGRIMLILNHARLTARIKTHEFLFFKWAEGEAELQHTYISFYLDREAYAKTRDRVEGILDDTDMAEIELRL